MLYVTCSVFKAEGEQQIAAFLKQHGDAALLPTLGHCLPLMGESATQNTTNPGQSVYNGFPNQDHDGFFYALLRKAA
jgi:16S rRNA (cytosine967-C5)-methyltransferase